MAETKTFPYKIGDKVVAYTDRYPTAFMDGTIGEVAAVCGAEYGNPYGMEINRLGGRRKVRLFFKLGEVEPYPLLEVPNVNN